MGLLFPNLEDQCDHMAELVHHGLFSVNSGFTLSDAEYNNPAQLFSQSHSSPDLQKAPALASEDSLGMLSICIRLWRSSCLRKRSLELWPSLCGRLWPASVSPATPEITIFCRMVGGFHPHAWRKDP
jgi:hypothetical protein